VCTAVLVRIIVHPYKWLAPCELGAYANCNVRYSTCGQFWFLSFFTIELRDKLTRICRCMTVMISTSCSLWSIEKEVPMCGLLFSRWFLYFWAAVKYSFTRDCSAAYYSGYNVGPVLFHLVIQYVLFLVTNLWREQLILRTRAHGNIRLTPRPYQAISNVENSITHCTSLLTARKV
jgi:hypothetical protein